jgi:hypothetical protein
MHPRNCPRNTAVLDLPSEAILALDSVYQGLLNLYAIIVKGRVAVAQEQV